MKWFNFKQWFKNPRFQKWGLFSLLALSLGFNLSMNPEHYNNIVRYEKGSPLHSYELATEAVPAAVPAVAAVVAAANPAANPEKSHLLTIGGVKGTFDVKVFQVNGATFATFKKVQSSTEAAVGAPGACDLCSIAAMPLSSSFDKIDDVKIELTAVINGKKEGSAVQTPVVSAACPVTASNKPKDGSLTEITDEQLKSCADTCAKLKGDEKTTCHKDRLLALSKALEDNDAQAKIVEKYFKSHLYSTLRNHLTNATVYETQVFDCQSFASAGVRPVYGAQWGNVGCLDTANFDFANEIVKEMLTELPATNGKSVMGMLLGLEKASFAAQARNAQEIAKAGLRENNPYKLQFGMESANPMFLEGYLNNTRNFLMGAINDRSDDTFKREYAQMLNSGFYNPVNQFISEMKNCGSVSRPNQMQPQTQIINGQVVQVMPNQQQQQLPLNGGINNGSNYNGGCRSYVDYQIPPFEGVGAGAGSGVYTPGNPGNLGGIYLARQNNGRSTIPQTWLTGFNTNFQQGVGTQVIVPGQQPQMVQPNGQPQNGMRRGRGG